MPCELVKLCTTAYAVSDSMPPRKTLHHILSRLGQQATTKENFAPHQKPSQTACRQGELLHHIICRLGQQATTKKNFAPHQMPSQTACHAVPDNTCPRLQQKRTPSPLRSPRPRLPAACSHANLPFGLGFPRQSFSPSLSALVSQGNRFADFWHRSAMATAFHATEAEASTGQPLN